MVVHSRQGSAHDAPRAAAPTFPAPKTADGAQGKKAKAKWGRGVRGSILKLCSGLFDVHIANIRNTHNAVDWSALRD